MSVEVWKRPNESSLDLVKRFSARVIKAGILLEAKKRLFYQKKPNKRARKLSKLYRLKKQEEYERKKKLGLI
ncbi:30S ribosomal protein S21 [bacterium]|nr:30S ribosomal protein S21 [bacterium]HDM32035.1 30S ribosomal protein S21 [bacterium]